MTFRLFNNNHIISPKVMRVYSLFLISFLFSQILGTSDLGFRSALIDLKLSQKYPPAVALNVINSTHPEDTNVSTTLSDQSNIIQLRAEYPDLGLLSLDELNFSYRFENTNKKADHPIEPFNNLETSNSKFSMASNSDIYPVKNKSKVPEDYFTEEEKLRLKMANLRTDLSIDDITPASNSSLKDRINEIISKEKATDPTGKSNPVSKNTTSHNSSVINTIPIHGDIEFSRDASPPLALTDQHFIDVRRFEEGIPKEVAQVNLVNGTFSMNLQSTRGILVGRLTNKLGRVDGEGVISVLDFVNSNNPKLVLKKIQNRLPAAKSTYGNSGWKPPNAKNNNDPHNSSLNSFSSSLFLVGNPSSNLLNFVPTTNNINTSKNLSGLSTFESSNLDLSSEFVLEANADFHRPTIAISSAMSDSDILMLPDRMLNGLTEILLEQDITLNFNRGDSLIWGVVKDHGRPVDGAVVTSIQAARTSYFGGLYLPDITRTMTSENGMFSITLSSPGWNEIEIELKDGRKIHANALVYPGKVSHVEVEVPDINIPITVRSYDAFSGEPVKASVNFQQLEAPVEILNEGFINIEIPKSNHLSFVQVTPDSPFEKIRISYTKINDYLHIPLFSRNWLDGLKSNIKVSDEMHTGDIVGFVQGDNFIVELQNKETSSKIIYFDQQGHPTNYGIAGGGFIILNLEEDQVNLTVISERTSKEIVRIIRPDKEWTQVINANFE